MNWTAYQAIFLFAGLLASPAVAQQVLHVNPSATGSGSGADWPNAFADLHAALAAAGEGDTVWVAQGTYRPSATGDREAYFELKDGVRLYGGFSGSETALAQRDWAAHPAVLDGDIGLPGDSTDNSYTILYIGLSDSTTVVDGFVFRHGNADGPDGTGFGDVRHSGGALNIEAKNGYAYPKVHNCRFERNSAAGHGGAVYVEGRPDGSVAPQFRNCAFTGNRAGLDGGAVCRNGGSWAETRNDFWDCAFAGNSAHRGGGLFCADSERSDSLEVVGCTFEGNSAAGASALWLFSDRYAHKANVRVSNCSFLNNKSSIPINGDVHCAPAAFVFLNSFALEGCVFQDTTPAVPLVNKKRLTVTQFPFDEGSSIQVKNCVFDNGLIALESIDGEITVSGSKFKDFGWKTAETAKTKFHKCEAESIRSFYNFSTDTVVYENCLFRDCATTEYPTRENDVNLLFRNSTFYRNSFYDDFSFEGSSLSEGSATYENCIFTENAITARVVLEDHITLDTVTIPFQYFVPAKEIYVSHSLTDAPGCSAAYAVSCGPGMLYAADPMFLDTAAGDFRLHPCSPARDAGDSAAAAATDLAGLPRIQGTAVDMGAHESPAFRIAAAATVQPPCGNGQPGTVRLLLEGGCPPYLLDWGSGSATAGTDTVYLALPAGGHAVTATDGRMAADTLGLQLVPVPALSGSLDVAPAGCAAGTGGTAAATPVGGTAPFAFLWSQGDTTPVAAGLPAGPVSVTVTDANGCAWADGAEVQAEGGVPLGISVSPPSCHGAQDATAEALPQGGLPPFAWEWSNGGTAALLDGIGGGSYSVTVTDALGCTGGLSFLLNGPLPVAVAVSLEGPACAGGAAAALASATGGSGAFSFLWSTGAATAATGLPPGAHSVTATDGNGCTGEAAVTVTAPPPLSAAVAVTGGMPCNGQHTGVLAALPSGGVPPYAYAWGGQPGTDSLLAGVPAGGYALTVTDAGGCTAAAAATLPEWPPIVLAGTVTHASGPGAADGAIAVTAVSGGSGAGYASLWENGETGPSVGQLPPGTYSLTVTDGAGCTAVFPFTVSVASAVPGPPGGPFRAAVVPNPSGAAGAALAFGGPVPPGLTVSVVDVTGRELATGHGTALPTGLPPGTYFVVLEAGQHRAVLEWVVW